MCKQHLFYVHSSLRDWNEINISHKKRGLKFALKSYRIYMNCYVTQKIVVIAKKVFFLVFLSCFAIILRFSRTYERPYETVWHTCAVNFRPFNNAKFYVRNVIMHFRLCEHFVWLDDFMFQIKYNWVKVTTCNSI